MPNKTEEQKEKDIIALLNHSRTDLDGISIESSRDRERQVRFAAATTRTTTTTKTRTTTTKNDKGVNGRRKESICVRKEKKNDDDDKQRVTQVLVSWHILINFAQPCSAIIFSQLLSYSSNITSFNDPSDVPFKRFRPTCDDERRSTCWKFLPSGSRK